MSSVPTEGVVLPGMSGCGGTGVSSKYVSTDSAIDVMVTRDSWRFVRNRGGISARDTLVAT